MANIQLAEILKKISGSLGDYTYSQTVAGIIIKKKSQPGSKNKFSFSDLQLYNQSLLSQLMTSWQTIKDSERQGWTKVASIFTKKDSNGIAFHPSGYNLFLSLNSNLQMINVEINSPPPRILPVDGLMKASLIISGMPGLVLKIFFPKITTSMNTSHMIYATPGMSPGRSYVLKQYRMIGVLPAGTADSYYIDSLYTAFFPLPDKGKKVFIKLVPVDRRTGFSGTQIFFNSINTANPEPEYWTLNKSKLNVNCKLQ